MRYPAIGGAFGGREDISVQIVLALAAWKTGRPVKIVWSREESIVGHHKRHPFTIHAKWGATRDGKIVAAQVDVTSDCGAYAYTSTKVLGNALMAVLGPYADSQRRRGGAHCLHQQHAQRRVSRLWRPAGPLRRRDAGQQAGRGAGHGPGRAAHAQPLARRRLSCLPARPCRPASPWSRRCCARLRSVGARHATAQTPVAVAEPHSARHGAALAATPPASRSGAPASALPSASRTSASAWASRNSCHAWVELYGAQHDRARRRRLRRRRSGPGRAHASSRQIAAEALGIDPALVEVRAEHTDVVGSSGSASASRMSFMAGNAIKGAAERALRAWQNEERPARGRVRLPPAADHPLRPPDRREQTPTSPTATAPRWPTSRWTWRPATSRSSG